VSDNINLDHDRGRKNEVCWMDLGMESHVWALAQQVLGDPGFTSTVDKLVGEYKRRPGIDVTERLHASDNVTGSSTRLRGV
jgi:hypothetical protein